MRILVAGAAGTVGQAAVKELARRHQIVTAGRSSGDVTVDLMSEDSVRAMYEKVGKVDAVVATAGHVHFGPLATMSPEQFRKGLNDKLMGQINVALIGMNHVADGGSITLTSGVTNRDPIRKPAISVSPPETFDGAGVTASPSRGRTPS